MVLMSSSYLIDPFGILEPDEIYFHANRCIKPDPLLDPFPNFLVGPVLVGSFLGLQLYINTDLCLD